MSSDEKVLSVSEINHFIMEMFDNIPLLGNIWIKGEISNFKHHTSGHMYFSLKDGSSKINAVMFRGYNRLNKFRMEDGQKVLIRGKIRVYERDGVYNLYAEEVRKEGTGSLYEEFEKLKKKLSGEGLFDASRKKRLPLLPKIVGLITSPTGAAVRDILKVIFRRYPNMGICLYPVRVQGDGSSAEIVRALKAFNRQHAADVIILARGGGSIEDLWSFNDEQVAREICASAIPVVTGIGHEIDFTIADFAADLRAPTPSAAAELAVPEKEGLLAAITGMRERISSGMAGRLKRDRMSLERAGAGRIVREISRYLEKYNQDIDGYTRTMELQLRHAAEISRGRVTGLAASLRRWDPRQLVNDRKKDLRNAKKLLEMNITKELLGFANRSEGISGALKNLNPLAILERGFSVVYNKTCGAIVASAGELSLDDELAIRFAKGGASARVTGLSKEKKGDKRDEEQPEI